MKTADRDRDVDEANGRKQAPEPPKPNAPLARLIGHTRYVVLVAVAAVLLVSLALFILGAWLAVTSVGHAVMATVQGNPVSTDLTVEFLEVVSAMLKAVVFYIIGVGMYSLFITPLNITTALGVDTLNDLETKIISIVVVIMAVTFLEHFIQWQQPFETMQFGATLAVVTTALVLFSWHTDRSKKDQGEAGSPTQVRAQRELFEKDKEEREVRPDEATAGARDGER